MFPDTCRCRKSHGLVGGGCQKETKPDLLKMRHFPRCLEEHRGLIRYHSFSDQETPALCNHIRTANEQQLV